MAVDKARTICSSPRRGRAIRPIAALSRGSNCCRRILQRALTRRLRREIVRRALQVSTQAWGRGSACGACGQGRPLVASGTVSQLHVSTCTGDGAACTGGESAGKALTGGAHASAPKPSLTASHTRYMACLSPTHATLNFISNGARLFLSRAFASLLCFV